MASRKTKKKDPSAKTPAIQYEPTPQEIAVIKGYAKRDKAKPGTRIKVSNKGSVPHLSVDHPDPALGGILLSEALGTADSDFVAGLLDQISNAATKGRAPEEDKINFMFSVIKSIEPRDELEAMLAAQMAATHMASMTFARRLNHVETIQQQDSAERAFTKLSRTFVAQMEALKRYRTGGQQRMTVEHVTVNEGGQAIVGNVTKGGVMVEKTDDNLLDRGFAFNKAPRCSATSKRTGKPCRAPAVRGWTVCRFHGARGGAPKGAANGRYRHGERTAEAIALRRELAALLKRANETLASLDDIGPVTFATTERALGAAPP